MTEVAEFSRATAEGYTGAGPLYWTVQRENGLTYTYGGTSNSRLEFSGAYGEWLLSEVQDRAGNKMRISWEPQDSTTQGTTHPTKIEWTQTSAGSGTYLNSMEFLYASGGNAPVSTQTGYILNTEVKDSDLLTRITVSVAGSVKRNYVLGYESSPTTTAKRLTQIKECSDDGSTPSDCLLPTNFTYQNGSAVNTSSPVLSLTNVTDANGEYDFDGDGIKDIAYKTAGTWHIRFGSISSGYSSAINTGLTNFNAGKLLGKPADQLLGVSGGTWYVYDWNGSSFSTISTGITVAASAARIALADVDADGRDDLNYATIGVPQTLLPWHVPGINIYVRKNTSSGGGLSFASAQLRFWSWPLAEETAPPDIPPDWADYIYAGYGIYQAVTDTWLSEGGDFNGDGREELNLHMTVHSGFFNPNNPVDYQQNILWGPVEQTHTVIHDHQGAMWVATSGDGWGTWSPSVVTEWDFNNDGCDDMQLVEPSQPIIGLSPCQWQPYQWILPAPYQLDPGSYFPWHALSGAADWTGDGVVDLFASGGASLTVFPAVGGALGGGVATGIPISGIPNVYRTDGNGDGLDDIVVATAYDFKIYQHNGTLAVPDLLTQVEDGFGVIHSVEYISIARGNYTAYSNAVHPYRDVRAGMNVVKKVTASDGVGGVYDKTYTYHGGVEHVEGRGFAGFDKVEFVDSRSGLKDERRYYQAFPYTGMLAGQSIYQPNGSGGWTVVSARTMTSASHVLSSTPWNERVFPYISGFTEDIYEVGGTRNGDWITHTEVTDTFDTWGNLTASTRVRTDKDSASSLYGYAWTESMTATISADTGANWCLGLPTYSSVTQSTTTGEATVQRIKSFTPDYANCRMSQEIVEPYNYPRRVETDYSYDTFGNVASAAVKGYNPNSSGMTTRTSYITWGSANGTAPGTGQFPVSETNALGQTTTRTFHPTFGSLVTATDPNSIVVTSNEYDAFGRVTRSIRADGTATRFTYAACGTPACENGDPGSGTTGINRMIVTASERDIGDSPVRDSLTYLDQFDRPIVQKSMTLAGAYSRSGTQYDTQGRVERQTAPCNASSCTAYWVTNTYDLLGRVIEQSRPQSQSLSAPVATTFTYAGRSQTVTDPHSKSSTKILDVNGRMRRSEDHDGYYQLFGYDGAGSLKSVTDSLSNTLFTADYSYGIRPFQTATTDMDLGSWGYAYNSLGELVSWTDAKSQSFSQAYDALSRVTSRTEPEGTTTFTFGTSAGNYNIGHLASASMTGYSESFSYDTKGRPSTQTITTDQVYAIDYAYTNQGLLDTLTYPTSTASTRVKVKYGYANGILNNVTDWTSGSAGTVYWTANAQNVRGQTTQETLGNGVVTNRGFDAVTGWLNSIQSGVSGGTGLQNQSYLYDLIGNVTQRQENTLGLTEDFYYDNLYRLDYSQRNAATNLDLTYDAMGNIAARSDVNGNAAWTYHGTKKHAVASTGSGGVSFSYDANGNMSGRAGSTISWSSFNYPTGLATATESTTFSYGPHRQYYRQVYTGSASPTGYEETHYVGGILEKVYDGSTTDWRHYIKAAGQTVAIVSRKSTSANTVHYPLEDHQGSASTLVDSAGAGYTRQSYSAFGLPRDGNDWDGVVSGGDQAAINAISRRGYTGHSMLGAMGLIHMNGRVQDAMTGRFLSPDPNIPNPGFTQMFNRYAYVNNNPLSYTDPTGFVPCPPGYEWSGNGCILILDQVDVTAPRGRPPSGCRVTREGCGYYAPPSPFGNHRPDCSWNWDSHCEGTGGQDSAPPEDTRQKDIERLRSAYSGKGPQSRHAYVERNLVCRRPLTEGEQVDLVGRFGIPNGYTQGRPQGGSGLHLVTAWGIPGGVVRSEFAQDGRSVRNTTTWLHAFVGTIDRRVESSSSAGYFATYGQGSAGTNTVPHNTQNLSMFTFYSPAAMRDLANQAFGPEIFESADRQAYRYARHHFEGC
jgi:RHS repeat-associated protein